MASYGNIAIVDSRSGIIPASIKWFTNSQFSHSLITMPDVLCIPMCIEAAEGGVDFLRWDTEYLNNVNEGYELWMINIDQSIKDTALISVLNDLEVSYGFLQYPYFILRRIFSLFGKDIKSWNNWFRKDGMICSQLCVAYLKACGLERVLAGYGNGSIAPQDLQNIFKAHPELFEKTQSIRLSV